NRSEEKIAILHEQLSKKPKLLANLTTAEKFSDFSKLNSPRIVWSMLPAGEATESILFGEDGVAKVLSPGDILIDGGNANFHDTQRRYENLKNQNIRFLGIGVSGGLIAFDQGYPLMVGGDKEAFDLIKPILETLSKPNGGQEYFGEGG